IPPSSLYCCQRSVSRISAAARNLRMAASPGVRPLLFASAKADTSFSNRPPPTVPAPTASPVSRNERRLVKCSQGFMISSFWPPPTTQRNDGCSQSVARTGAAEGPDQDLGRRDLGQWGRGASVLSTSRRRCSHCGNVRGTQRTRTTYEHRAPC